MAGVEFNVIEFQPLLHDTDMIFKCLRVFDDADRNKNDEAPTCSMTFFKPQISWRSPFSTQFIVLTTIYAVMH